MKRFSFSALLILGILFLSWPMQIEAQAQKPIDVVLFYGNSCPHCHSAIAYLEELENDFPQLQVHDYEVYEERENIPLFMEYAAVYDIKPGAVPSLFIGEEAILGDDQPAILAAIKNCADNGCQSALTMVGDEPPPEPEPMLADDQLNEPLAAPAGSKNTQNTATPPTPEPADGALHQLTLPAIISGAAVDAINPCAFAVLIILITTVLGSGNRRRALLAGLAFSASVFISYFLIGLGLYSAVAAAGVSRTFYIVVSILAIIIGLFNLKDWLWYGKWFVMEVPRSWRPRMQSLLRGVTSVPGAFVMGIIISLFLLPCTSGPYVVILGLLAKTTTRTSAIGYLLLYNAVFVLPMVIITLAVTLGITSTERAEAWRQSKLRLLHLISGIIILALGVIMLGSVVLDLV